MKTVLVTGGRGYADKEFLYDVLARYHQRNGISHVIYGAAPGADSLAGQWARENGVQPVACPANWDYYKRRGGMLRNEAMAQLGPDVVIAFPGNNGTANMIEIATKYEIEVLDALNYRR